MLPLLSMRSVVSAVSAALVVVVVLVTFTTTYFTGLAAIDSVGRAYTLAVVNSAQYQVSAYFDYPARRLESIGRMARLPGFMLPIHDPTVFGVLNRTTELLLALQLETLGSADFLNVIFDDGSRATTQIATAGIAVRSMIHAGFITNNVTRCCGKRITLEYYLDNMTAYTGPTTVPVGLLGDARAGSYTTLRLLLFGATRGLWSPPVYVNFLSSGNFELPAFFPIRNSSDHYLGIAIGSYSVSNVGAFLQNVKPTKASEIFALDKIGTILSTTHESPFVVQSSTNDANARLSENCASTAAVETGNSTDFVIGCRSYARDFPFRPLQAASADSELTAPAGPIVKVLSVSGGGKYYAAATPVENRFRAFAMNLILLTPEADVVGDIYTARNITLAIVSVVLVAAVIAAFVVSHAVLAPLAVVSRQMHLTSRLRDDGTAPTTTVNPDGSVSTVAPKLSALSEIRELQIAYTAMSTAIKSFTRYVPREVVKDLIASGQLCEIAMRPHHCAILFSDIAGFTSMCERVPVAELSQLVSVYFDRMSAAVMSHDGVVDKFIGDAVMAVWGAPIATGHESLKALMAALTMIRETRTDPIRRVFDEAGELLRIRVGVSAGEVLAGNMGCAARMNYTVIGDDVNLSARLESLCKQFGVNILASASAYAAAQKFVVGRRLRQVAVVGKEEAVAIYDVVGIRMNPDADELAALKTEARQMHRDATWSLDVGSSVGRGSSLSTTYAAGGVRRHEDNTARTVPDMLALLSALNEPPVVLPEAVERYCDLYSDATVQLDARNPAAAMESLRRADEACSGDTLPFFVPSAATDAAALVDRCEEALRDPDGFDPVLNLLTKS